MMPLVRYSNRIVTSPEPFGMDVGLTTVAAVNAIAGSGGLLEAAGWTQGPFPGGSYATAHFNFPFGVPGLSFGIPDFEVDAVWYRYVAGGTPGHPTLSGGVVTVPLGSDSDDATAAALVAAAVTLFSQWTATANMTGAASFTLDLKAKTTGTGPNDSIFGYNAENCVLTSAPSGGSCTWLSQTNPAGSQIQISLIAGPSEFGLTNCSILLTFPAPLGGAQPAYTWVLAARGAWNFWADPYSLCFWMMPGSSGESGDPYPAHTFFFAGVPRNTQVTYGALPYGGISQAFAHWDPNQTLIANYTPGVDELNGVFTTGVPNCAIAAPSIASYELDGKGAVDPIVSGHVGLPILLPARLGLPFPGGYGGAITTYVVGQLYDAFVACAQYPLGTVIPYDGHQWIAMLSQPGATLFLCSATAAGGPYAVVPWTSEIGAGGDPGGGGAAVVGNFAL